MNKHFHAWLEPRWVRAVLTVLFVFVLALLATVPLEWKDQAILGAVFVAVVIGLDRRSRDHQTTLAMMIISVFVTSRYVWWRFSETMPYLLTNWSTIHPADIFFVLLLLGAEAYAYAILVLGYFQSARPLRRKPAPLPDDADEWPSVDVFVPTYNEPVDVIRTTVLAARNMDWPPDRLKIYVLDDGRRGEVQQLAEVCEVGYIARLDNEGAKAGNINHALTKTDGEFVAVFDSDHVPTRSFLQATMGWFLKDCRLAIVQTPHHFYSPDPFERNLGTFRRVPNESELFYGVVQDGNDFWNASFFCGSCAVLRRRAIEQIGGIATETVTEDSHSSVRLQRLGWNTAYISLPQAAGLATANLADHITQRIRWARGMVQVLRVEQPLLAKGLTLPQRLCYFNAAIHFLHAAPRLIFLTAPLVFLLLGRSNVYGYVWAILAYVIPHLLLATITNSRVHGGHRHSFWNEVFETILAPYILVPTLLALVNPRWGRFNVTPKHTEVKQSYFDLRVASPFIILLLLNLAGLAAGIHQILTGADAQGTVIVNLAWTAINILIVGAALAVPWERHQRRACVRVPVRLAVRLGLPDGSAVEGVALDLSAGGAAVQLQRSCSLQPGDDASILVQVGGAEYGIPVRIRRTNGLRLGLSFSFRSIEDHEIVTRLIFSRADAWLNWTEGRPKDRPLRSLGRIVFISLLAILRVPKGLLSRPASEETPLQHPEPKRAPAVPLIWLTLAAGLLAAASVKAEPFSDLRDLRALGYRQPVMFHGREGRLNLRFGVPATKIVHDASLTVSIRSSGGFLADNSKINISLNGSPVGSIAIPAHETKGDAPQQTQIALPSDLVVADNLLTFQLAANCAGGCRDTMHWVRLESTTGVRLSGTLLELANDLRLLPAPFFDSWLHRPLRVPIVFSEQPDQAMLEAAGIVASWLGVMADDRGAEFTSRIGAPESGDAIFLTKNKGPLSDSLQLGGAASPVIALRNNPADNFGKLLILCGSTGGDILVAARALSLGLFPKNGDTAVIPELNLPPPSSPYDAPRWLNPERAEGLLVGLMPDQLRVSGSGSVSLYFRIPPDLSFGQRSTIPLRLVFRTKGVFPDQKADVKVRLNGVHLMTRRVSAPELPTVQRQTISLPVSSLYLNNTLEIEFLFASRQSSTDDRYAEAAIMAGTSVDLRGVPRFVQLPKLDLLVKSGFPFTRLADLSGTAIVFPETPSIEEMELFLTLMGRFGAQTGYPSLRVAVISPLNLGSATNKDLLVIGTPEDQPLILRWSSSMSLRVVHKHLQPSPRSGFEGLLTRLPLLAAGREWRRLEDTLVADGRPEALIHGFPSPLNSNQNVVLISASESFQPLISALSGENLGDISGSVSLLDSGRFQSFAVRTARTSIGGLNWREAFYNWMAANFLLVAATTALVAIVLSRWFHQWSERHALNRLRGEA